MPAVIIGASDAAARLRLATAAAGVRRSPIALTPAADLPENRQPTQGRIVGLMCGGNTFGDAGLEKPGGMAD